MGTKKQSKPIQEAEVNGLGIVSAGKRVSHPMFGLGEVLEIAEHESGEITLNIEFAEYGSKWLLPEFAKLTEAPNPQNKSVKKGFLNRLFGQ